MHGERKMLFIRENIPGVSVVDDANKHLRSACNTHKQYIGSRMEGTGLVHAITFYYNQ